MAVIVGLVIVLGAVLLGFTMAGGKVGALLHLSEFVTIGGSSLGALIVMSPTKVIRDLLRGTLQVVKGSPYNKQTCLELFRFLYAVARTIRRDGMLALEPIISNPNGPLFKKYPRINGNHHIKE